ncbi:MAG: hypothetical protein HYW89_02725 [Candidatus Sungiibacteriota bacterium]|uniref:Uncharacterized protein n=1 Tax=Candidatus Sungiibacteriota bacterium TaxID=2750080 RepID=A0A7T5RIT5_9BACT|nr:MAG: hypothetical protein HYW89_02725 [Candidatus Sungbacteria bacterium]
MPKPLMWFQCIICDEVYKTEEEAAHCEKQGLSPIRYPVNTAVLLVHPVTHILVDARVEHIKVQPRSHKLFFELVGVRGFKFIVEEHLLRPKN